MMNAALFVSSGLALDTVDDVTTDVRVRLDVAHPGGLVSTAAAESALNMAVAAAVHTLMEAGMPPKDIAALLDISEVGVINLSVNHIMRMVDRDAAVAVLCGAAAQQ